MPVEFPVIEDNLDNKYLLSELKVYTKQTGQVHNYDFLVDTSDNKKLYAKWISPKSKAQVNLSSRVQLALDAQATQKKWSDMTANIKLARVEVCKDLRANIRMAITGKPYLRRAAELVKMGVATVAVADKAKPHLATYLDSGSTPEEKFKAYKGLQAIVTKSKLVPVLRLMDAPPPEEPESAEVTELLENIRPAMKAGLEFFENAEKALDKKGVPTGDQVLITRMFQSGRMRHEKVHTDYVEAIKLDSEFKNRHKDVVKDKLKLDEEWAKYRQRLGKR